MYSNNIIAFNTATVTAIFFNFVLHVHTQSKCSQSVLLFDGGFVLRKIHWVRVVIVYCSHGFKRISDCFSFLNENSSEYHCTSCYNRYTDTQWIVITNFIFEVTTIVVKIDYFTIYIYSTTSRTDSGCEFRCFVNWNFIVVVIQDEIQNRTFATSIKIYSFNFNWRTVWV